MPDRHLQKLRDLLLEVGQIMQVQVMSSIDAQSEFSGQLGYLHIGLHGFGTVHRIAQRIRLGIQLYPIGTCKLGRFKEPSFRIDKDGYTRAHLLEFSDYILQHGLMPNGIPTGIGSNGRRWIRDQRGLSGLHGSDKFHKSCIGITLDIEFSAYHLRQVQHILVANVPLIGARMHGDSLCAKTFTIQRHFHYIGIIGSSGIPDGGNLIDIYT